MSEVQEGHSRKVLQPSCHIFWWLRQAILCEHCGEAYPWTERTQQAAFDLFIEESMDEKERQEFKESVEQITKDTPQAQVAWRRIAKHLGKMGKGAAQAIRDILVDVASETVKKTMNAAG